jgi:hypothetical protein
MISLYSVHSHSFIFLVRVFASAVVALLVYSCRKCIVASALPPNMSMCKVCSEVSLAVSHSVYVHHACPSRLVSHLWFVCARSIDCARNARGLAAAMSVMYIAAMLLVAFWDMYVPCEGRGGGEG